MPEDDTMASNADLARCNVGIAIADKIALTRVESRSCTANLAHPSATLFIALAFPVANAASIACANVAEIPSYNSGVELAAEDNIEAEAIATDLTLFPAASIAAGTAMAKDR